MEKRVMFKELFLITALACMLLICTSAIAQTNSIADVKGLNEGDPVHLEGKIVTKCLWNDRFYIYEPDRSCGIGVLSSAPVVERQIVSIDGHKVTQHGEVYIELDSPPSGTTLGDPIRPLGITTKSFLMGLSTTGLPLKVWGSSATGLSTDSYGTYFSLNDGGATSIKVYVGNSGVRPPTEGLCTVSGVSGMYDSTPVVLVGKMGDLLTVGTSDAIPATTIPEWLWSVFGLARVTFGLTYVTAASNDGADVIEVPVQDGSYSYYSTSVGTASPTYGDGSILQQMLDYLHGRNLKLIGSMPACKDAMALTAHTDWRQRLTDDTTWLSKPATQVTGCLVSPYGDYLINEIKELAQTVGLDGVSLQGYSNTQSFCYCTYCKTKYAADNGGAAMPTSVNYSDYNFRRYLLWHDAQIFAHTTSLRAQVRAVNPSFAILAWTSNGGEYSHYSASPHIMPTSLNSLFDCALQNAWYDDTNQGLSIVPDFGLRYLAGLTRNHPRIVEPSYLTRSQDNTTGVIASSMPEAEIQHRWLSAIAAGCLPSFSSTQKEYLRPSLLNLSRARSQWTYKANSIRWAALVVSENTRQFYGRSSAVSKYMGSCFGFLRAMIENHLPVDIITDTDLESGWANYYSVLILPDTACMSAAAISAVNNYIALGGGVVATGAASLYSEEGVQRSDFGLGSKFKVSYASSPLNLNPDISYISGNTYVRNQTAFDKLLSPSSRATAFVGELFPVNLLAGATADIKTNYTSLYPSYVTSQDSGFGRVVYMPAAFDEGYYKYSYPFEGLIMKDAVTWAAKSPPAITVVAPKSVQTTFFSQNYGKRHVVHLLNATNSRAGRSNPSGDLPMRDEVVPVYGIEVWFERNTPTTVRLQPENLTLTPIVEGTRTKVVVDTLNQHSMVVADIP